MTTKQDTPQGWQGSPASYVAYEAITRQGKEPQRDFSFIPRTQGRRLGLDIEADFVFNNPRGLALHIKESLSTHPRGIETRGTDIMAKSQLAGQGIMMILLDHDKLIQDPDWVIGEALQFREHAWE